MSMADLRKKIDVIDAKLVKLLSDRAKITQHIGEIKTKGNKPVYAPDREKKVFDKIKSLNRGPLSDESLMAVYREIMSGSLKLESQPVIAFLGPEHTFTHQASVQKFGHSVDYSPCQTIGDVFKDVENGRSDYGVVPVENSTEGTIYFTLDSFIRSDLKICAEIVMRIKLDLMSKEKSLKSVNRIYSNQAVFGQCRKWFAAQMPGIDLIPVASTAAGARMAASEKGAACIASGIVSKENKLKVLARNIQDSVSNTTRFLVLAKEDAGVSGRDKTSLMISLKDKPGSLQKVLDPFYRAKINLTKIQSRPSQNRKWHYVFFIDFEGHRTKSSVVKVLKQISGHSEFVKVLGSYPAAS